MIGIDLRREKRRGLSWKDGRSPAVARSLDFFSPDTLSFAAHSATQAPMKAPELQSADYGMAFTHTNAPQRRLKRNRRTAKPYAAARGVTRNYFKGRCRLATCA